MRVEEYDLCFSPPLPPTVWGELSLCFDVDFPIDTVSSILGVQPTEAKRQRACRWNAYAGTQNPGYWTITFDKTDTFDGDVVQRAMHTFIAEHERALRQVLEQFQPCTALLTIYAVVHQDGEYPSIRLNPYFLQDACRLSASVDSSQKKSPRQKARRFFGAPAGIRTPIELRIFSAYHFLTTLLTTFCCVLRTG